MDGVDDRPPPSPAKLLRQFHDWVEGSELPGRTMSHLKTGFLPDVLDGVDAGRTERMLAAWAEWEKGPTNPTAVLEVLRDEGLADLLTELVGS